MANDHLSIGEVLSLLQDEHPDITISKIRFLESRGLIDPERTPSGYRKFLDGDVARLRWVLEQQRDHFLPLKVIRERLDNDPPDFEAMAAGSSAGPRSGRAERTPLFGAGPPSGRHTAEEIAERSGLTPSEVREVEKLGLIEGRTYGDDRLYDDEALRVARLVTSFEKRGVSIRHLRMYKVAAEREAGFYEQLVMPMLKQRGTDGRAAARAALEELTDMGEQLRSAVLRQMFRDRLEQE